MNLRLLFVVSLVSLMALAACGGDDEPAASAVNSVTFDVVMRDIHYGETNDNATNPPVWTATAGDEITLNLDNQGALEHNWAIVKIGQEITEMPFDESSDQDKILLDAGLVAGKSKDSFTFTAPEAGEYQIICTVAGHSPLMRGKLIIN